MLARGSADSTASAFAVPGMSCSMPRAPAGERACGFIRDSSHATAASSEIGSYVSWAARRKAPTYAVGIPQAAARGRESFGAVDFAGAFSTTRDPSVPKPSNTIASAAAQTIGLLSGDHRLDSERRAAARRRDRAKTSSSSARVCEDVETATRCRSYPVPGVENRRPRSRGLCPLKVCARTPVARQSNDFRDREPSFFLGHLDSLADAW